MVESSENVTKAYAESERLLELAADIRNLGHPVDFGPFFFNRWLSAANELPTAYLDALPLFTHALSKEAELASEGIVEIGGIVAESALHACLQVVKGTLMLLQLVYVDRQPPELPWNSPITIDDRESVARRMKSLTRIGLVEYRRLKLLMKREALNAVNAKTGERDSGFLGLILDREGRKISRKGVDVSPIKLTDREWEMVLVFLDERGEEVPTSRFKPPAYCGSTKGPALRYIRDQLSGKLALLNIDSGDWSLRDCRKT
jgi:hypothetical protein